MTTTIMRSTKASIDGSVCIMNEDNTKGERRFETISARLGRANASMYIMTQVRYVILDQCSRHDMVLDTCAFDYPLAFVSVDSIAEACDFSFHRCFRMSPQGNDIRRSRYTHLHSALIPFQLHIKRLCYAFDFAAQPFVASWLSISSLVQILRQVGWHNRPSFLVHRSQ